MILRHGRELYADILETKVLVDLEDQVIDRDALVKELVLSAEDMSIILREASHAH
ncbi:hypothetical protein D3C71_2168100 [compost metagenome]